MMATGRPAQSQGQLAFRRFMKEPTAILGLVIIVFFLLAALLAPWVAPYDPLKADIPASLAAPGAAHLMGADKLGRDILSRIMHGARISMFTDIFFAFPSLILAMAIAGALGPSLENALVAVAVVSWPVYARLLRGQVIVLREREFVQAARAVGVTSLGIIFRHLLPNTMGPLLVQATFDLGGTILAVAGLSFIGFGAQPPTPEWGVMISEGRNYITTQWWLTFFPAMSILLVVAGFNLVGDGLRDVLDPRLRK
jgi:peptide/nickel transport system permease protein